MNKEGEQVQSPSSPDPLLIGETVREESIPVNVGIFSNLFVTWLSPLLALGYKRPIQADDLPPLRVPFHSTSLKSSLLKFWPPTDPHKRYCLVRSLLASFGGPFYAAGFLKLLGDMAGMSSPLLMRIILKDLQQPALSRDFYIGLLFCFGIFILQMINTLSVNAYFSITMQTGLKMRTSLSALLYQKSLRLSPKARLAFPGGQMVNLMSTDAGRVELAASYFHYLWSGPFQVIVIVGVLFHLLGWAAFVGFFFLVIGIPIQSKITTKLSEFRKETSKSTDKRVRMMQELINGIRVIKFYAWESSFLSKLFEIREYELQRIRKIQVVRSLTVVLTSVTAIFACIVTLIVHLKLTGTLTADVVFPTMALFNLLRLPLILLPMVISMVVDGAVASGRLQKFLLAEELSFEPTIESDSPYGIEAISPSFTYESVLEESTESKKSSSKSSSRKTKENNEQLTVSTTSSRPEPFKLKDLNIKITRGNLVAVVGGVGSGKSSLLNALAGELRPENAKESFVRFSGSVAYCPQQAWIQNATVRENILFGLPFYPNRYEAVINACALLPDFDMLPDGDMTEIGEKGVNLSGGQKQRISLARAAYTDASIILLDDPLSAVDAHVGKVLMKKCICGLMAGKTRVLVTHQLQLLPLADEVLVVEEGKIIASGAYRQLIRENDGFIEMIKAGLGDGAISDELENSSPSASAPQELIGDSIMNETLMEARPMPPSAVENSSTLISPTSTTNEEGTSTPVLGKNIKTIVEEERVIGSVDTNVYKEYIAAAGGVIFVIWTVGSIGLWNLSRVGTDYWVASWTRSLTKNDPTSTAISPSMFISIYMALGGLQGIFAVLSSFAVSWGAIKAARSLHKQSASHTVQAPVKFFDTNPSGRILNRFSKDLETLDNSLPETIRSLTNTFGLTVFTFATIIFVNVYFTIPLILLLILYWKVQSYYRHTSRELKRIENMARSPLYAHFGETLSGLGTIRAYHRETFFTEKNLMLLDIHNKAAFCQQAIQRWLGIRLESIGNLIILAAAICCYLFEIPPALAGLAISYSLGVTGVMNWCIRQFADTETQIISSERLGEYAKLSSEDDTTVVNPLKDSSSWTPKEGNIVFDRLTMRYRPELPPVLNKVTLEIRGGERIGIVGRTGAGKSSIIMALFRVVQPSQGAIFIDGTNISEISLTRLRRYLSIIPQDPIVFSGTVRWNLDPLGECSDQELWSALSAAHLKDAILRLEGGGLDAPISEGGENLSVGQRQLLCLARAILRRNKILVLDEATANVDLATDALIQKTIRSEFNGCTIITIAHRIATVMDYDRILVLEAGQVAEYDSPSNLLARPTSLFSSLVKETGDLSYRKD